jgi:hypothetical protein
VRNVYRVLVGIPESKNSVGRLRHRRRMILKWFLQTVRGCVLDLSASVAYKTLWCANETSEIS